MESHIFVEGSNTTADDQDLPLRQYYRGLFSTAASLYDNFEDLSDAHFHVLSDTYGAVDAKKSPNSLSKTREIPVGFEKMIEEANQEIINAAESADVMVLLFSTDVFSSTVGEIWDDIVDAAKPGAIYCLGAARGALNKIDAKRLESKGCTVITYQRVGVARIGTETKEELIEAVRQKASQ